MIFEEREGLRVRLRSGYGRLSRVSSVACQRFRPHMDISASVRCIRSGGLNGFLNVVQVRRIGCLGCFFLVLPSATPETLK